MKIQFDKYTGKYFLYITDSNVVALSFDELEHLAKETSAICSEVYSAELQAELDMGGEDCEGGACKI